MVKNNYHLSDSILIILIIIIFSFLFSFYNTSGYKIFYIEGRFIFYIFTSILLAITYSLAKKYLFKNCEISCGLTKLLLALSISEGVGFVMYMIITGAIIRHPDSPAIIVFLFFYFVSLIITVITYFLLEFLIKGKC